ncbi:FHA domain-containing protein [Rhodobacterales bacterium HKCCE2091]|nr:FHA domain-containing protein [Rhodobacterales bacterium HKCCE2091]
MSGNSEYQAAVLFADVTGSTTLYQDLGNAAAAEIVNARVAGMKRQVALHDGVFVKASGDDVLCWFADADKALTAALAMLEPPRPGDLDVHVGMQWGDFVYRDGDVFGDCVNSAARLCSLAKPKELLVGEGCFQRLHPSGQAKLAEVSPLRLKGRREASRLYSVQLATSEAMTRFVHDPAPGDRPANDAVIRFGPQEWRITEGDSLGIGRSPANAVVVPEPTVSRQHATVTISNGLVEYADHSSAGSYVTTSTSGELPVFRRVVVLSGTGTVSLGGRMGDPAAPHLSYEVVAR